METREMQVYNGKVYGVKVSDYGLEHGYLDYAALSEIAGEGVLNNNILISVGFESWELVNGSYDEEVYQYYIIPEYGYKFLEEYTDEVVYYNEELDMYLWGITHFGTSWDYVLTDIKLKEVL